MLSGSTAPASAAQHDSIDVTNAANIFLQPDQRIHGLVHKVNATMSDTDRGASGHKRGDPVRSPAVFKNSLISRLQKDFVVQDWVWWCIVIVVIVILVLCFLWLFCLRGKSKPTPNLPVKKTEEVNGNQARQTTVRNGVHINGTSGSPPTPVKTPLAVLTAAPRSSREQLCPALLVSESDEMRFVLAQNIFSWTPRQAQRILDSNGRCIANAEGTCIGSDRMALRSPTDDLLCEVQRRSLDFADQNVFDIFHPHGQLFGVLEKDTLNPIFTVTTASGVRLLMFQGDFLRKEIDITDAASGAQLAQTGHGFFQFSRVGHYQVRVASGVDAGLIIACCLAIDEADLTY